MSRKSEVVGTRDFGSPIQMLEKCLRLKFGNLPPQELEAFTNYFLRKAQKTSPEEIVMLLLDRVYQDIIVLKTAVKEGQLQ